MSEQVKVVGLAQMVLETRPEVLLVAYGLGSCVGVVIYDKARHIGGMAHVMLPRKGSANCSTSEAKYADTCIPAMIQKLTEMGAVLGRLEAKIAGGARVLNADGPLPNIGQLNVEVLLEQLKQARVPVVGADVGGNYGRTMRFHLGSGRVWISTVGHGEKLI